MSDIDVVLVTYEAKEYLPRLMEALHVNSQCSQELYPYENVGNEKTLTELWNALAFAGTSEFICFLNPDTIPSPAWDRRIVEAMRADPKIAAAAPGVNNGHPNQITEKVQGVPSQQQLEAISQRIKGQPVKYAGFYGSVMIFRRDIFEDVHGFDGRFRLYGQESEYVWRMPVLGYKNAVVQSSFVFHHGAKGVRVAREKQTIDFKGEQRHSMGFYRAVKEGKLKRWDLLSAAERAREALASEKGLRTPGIAP